MKPSRSDLIDAALTGRFDELVERFCDRQWDRLPALWDVPLEEVLDEAQRRGLERFVVPHPPSEGYWLLRTEQGFKTVYFERGVQSDIATFSELQPAFSHWLRCYLELYRLNV